MSTTYTVKRTANVFLNKDGERIFILNEVVYDSNVYPHTPRMHVVHIGDLNSTLDRIFSYAAHVEGGMLASPNGKLTTEGYIKSWIECIKNPYSYNPETPLDFEYYRMYPGVNKDFLNAVEERGTPATVMNHYDLAVNFYAFRCIPKTFSDDGYPYVGKSAISGYAPGKCNETPTHPTNFIKIIGEYQPYYIQMDDDGVGISAPEWLYRTMGDYVVSLYEQELSHPGSYKTCIPSFRDFLNALPETGLDNIVCSIKPVADSDEDFTAERKRELMSEYGDGQFAFDSVPSDKRYFLLNRDVRFMLKDASDWIAHNAANNRPAQVQESLFL